MLVGYDWVTPLYKTSAALFRTLPRPVAEGVTANVYGAVSKLSADRRLLVSRHLQRVRGEDFRGRPLERAIRETFKSYGHYWVESFRLPTMRDDEIDFEFSVTGLEHAAKAIFNGQGTIHVLPHLGGWEWAAFWIARVIGWQVTAVVEPVDPPELLDFFTEFRESLGIHVVPLGPDAGKAVLRALRAGHMVALLSDRDIEGTGVEVEFFGETTTLPAGPATLALRTGAPLLPTAVYFVEGGHKAVINAPVAAERRGPRLRDDVRRITQDLAHSLEDLIAQAPDQWHLQQPNWPSDWDALAAIGKPYPRPGARAHA